MKSFKQWWDEGPDQTPCVWDYCIVAGLFTLGFVIGAAVISLL